MSPSPSSPPLPSTALELDDWVDSESSFELVVVGLFDHLCALLYGEHDLSVASPPPRACSRQQQTNKQLNHFNQHKHQLQHANTHAQQRTSSNLEHKQSPSTPSPAHTPTHSQPLPHRYPHRRPLIHYEQEVEEWLKNFTVMRVRGKAMKLPCDSSSLVDASTFTSGSLPLPPLPPSPSSSSSAPPHTHATDHHINTLNNEEQDEVYAQDGCIQEARAVNDVVHSDVSNSRSSLDHRCSSSTSPPLSPLSAPVDSQHTQQITRIYDEIVPPIIQSILSLQSKGVLSTSGAPADDDEVLFFDNSHAVPPLHVTASHDQLPPTLARIMSLLSSSSSSTHAPLHLPRASTSSSSAQHRSQHHLYPSFSDNLPSAKLPYDLDLGNATPLSYHAPSTPSRYSISHSISRSSYNYDRERRERSSHQRDERREKDSRSSRRNEELREKTSRSSRHSVELKQGVDSEDDDIYEYSGSASSLALAPLSSLSPRSPFTNSTRMKTIKSPVNELLNLSSPLPLAVHIPLVMPVKTMVSPIPLPLTSLTTSIPAPLATVAPTLTHTRSITSAPIKRAVTQQDGSHSHVFALPTSPFSSSIQLPARPSTSISPTVDPLSPTLRLPHIVPSLLNNHHASSTSSTFARPHSVQVRRSPSDSSTNHLSNMLSSLHVPQVISIENMKNPQLIASPLLAHTHSTPSTHHVIKTSKSMQKLHMHTSDSPSDREHDKETDDRASLEKRVDKLRNFEPYRSSWSRSMPPRSKFQSKAAAKSRHKSMADIEREKELAIMLALNRKNPVAQIAVTSSPRPHSSHADYASIYAAPLSSSSLSHVNPSSPPARPLVTSTATRMFPVAEHAKHKALTAANKPYATAKPTTLVTTSNSHVNTTLMHSAHTSSTSTLHTLHLPPKHVQLSSNPSSSSLATLSSASIHYSPHDSKRHSKPLDKLAAKSANYPRSINA